MSQLKPPKFAKSITSPSKPPPPFTLDSLHSDTDLDIQGGSLQRQTNCLDNRRDSIDRQKNFSDTQTDSLNS